MQFVRGRASDICTNYFVAEKRFSCTAIGKYYKIKGDLTCNSTDVTYVISCKVYMEQYVGSAIKGT